MAAPPDQAYKNVIPLDFGSVTTLPESFVWPESDDVYSGSDQPSIPVIDLRDPNAAKLIIQACEAWGAFQLIGHEIPRKLVEDLESEAHRLFALPADQKLKTLRIPAGGPTVGYGNPPSQALLPRKLWHEGFTIMGSPVDQAKVLWPHDYQGFCDTMDAYQKQVKALVEQLIHIIFKFLSIPEEVNWFDDPTNMCHAVLQLNSYPPCPNPTRAVGLAPHTDSSLITVLHSRTEGLQIFKDGVGWIRVQPNTDALTVNLGDFLHFLSNGRFVSVLHRAVVNENYHRISVAYLCFPPMNFIVSPLLSKTLADSGQVPKYRPVTLKEYRGLKAKNFQEALSVVKT